MICAYLTLDSLVNARRILISVRGLCAARKRGRTAAARDYRSSGALGAAASSFPPSFLHKHKGPCSILVPLHFNLISSTGTRARHFLVMAAAPSPLFTCATRIRSREPAPVFSNRGTAEEQQRNSRGTSLLNKKMKYV